MRHAEIGIPSGVTSLYRTKRTSHTKLAVIMRRRIITLTAAYVGLIICMTAGWHTWPLAVGLGLWFWGYRITEDRLTLSDREIRALLNG